VLSDDCKYSTEYRDIDRELLLALDEMSEEEIKHEVSFQGLDPSN
jgi:hypothetical protein